MHKLEISDIGDGGEVGERAATPARPLDQLPPIAHGLNEDADPVVDHSTHRDVESVPDCGGQVCEPLAHWTPKFNTKRRKVIICREPVASLWHYRGCPAKSIQQP